MNEWLQTMVLLTLVWVITLSWDAVSSFTFKRRFILLGVLFSFAFPWVVPSFSSFATPVPIVELEAFIVGATSPQIIKTAITFPTWKLIYLTGFFILTLMFLKEFVQLIVWGKRITWETIDGLKVGESTYFNQPFSFFNWVVLPAELTHESKKIILFHEGYHNKLKHSADLLLIHSACLVLWFFPPIWFLKRALKNTHEYQVDYYTTKKFHTKTYQRLLLEMALGGPISMVSHSFSSKNLKTRISMMNLQKNMKNQTKTFFLLLFFGFALGVTSCEKEAIESNVTESKSVVFSLGDIDEWPSFPECASPEREKQIECFSQVLFTHLVNNLKYPDHLQKEGVEGRVFVSFVLNENGEIVAPKLKKGTLSLDGEPLKNQEYMQDFFESVVASLGNIKDISPAEKEGKPVSVEYTIPVVFKL